MIRRSSWLWALAVLGGCAPGDPGLIVGGALAPNQTCVYDVSNAQVHTGVLDIFAARNGEVRYVLTLRVFNQLVNLGSTSAPPRADPNVMQIQEARVELRDISGAPIAFPSGLPNPFTVPAHGLIPSAESGEAGEGIAVAEIIPPIYGNELGAVTGVTFDSTATVVASVELVGITAGGAAVVSSEYLWPIQVCEGCLIVCEINEEGTPRCVPNCTFGQDAVYVTPAACAGIAATCAPE